MTPIRRLNPRQNQRGVTTLVVVLSLLVIVTLLVLASTNIALFEQRTTTNENRQKLADQAAEYAMNMAGEYMKSNLSVLATASGSGWLATGGSKRWWSCNGKTTGPCTAERDVARRNKMYYWSSDSAGAYTTAAMTLPITSGTGVITNTGGAAGASFPVTSQVTALMCRIDTTLTSLDPATGTQKPAPDCALVPSTSSLNRVAIVLTSTASLANSDASITENATSTIKETWANYSGTAGASAVPLIASGSIEGLGNAEIVAAANGAGVGLPVSIWSSCPVDIEKAVGQTYPGTCVNPPGSGVGSVSTCNLGEFLKDTPEANLKTTCATSNPACGCPSFNTANSDFLSGHSNSNQRENVDILDVDGSVPGALVGALPDITFFPDRGLDSPTDSLDDNLFEWIFGQEVVAEGATTVTGCGPSLSVADTNLCADAAALVNTLGATVIATCDSLNSASSGLYYVTGDCSLPAQVGNANESVIVVVDGDAQGAQGVRVSGNTLFYGLLFIRSRYTMENPSNSVKLTGNGGVQFYGSVVVEGNVKITGSMRIVYENTNTDVPGKPLPASTRFARVPGTWLDSQTSF